MGNTEAGGLYRGSENKPWPRALMSVLPKVLYGADSVPEALRDAGPLNVGWLTPGTP